MLLGGSCFIKKRGTFVMSEEDFNKECERWVAKESKSIKRILELLNNQDKKDE